MNNSNVCFCKCHEDGLARCRHCKTLHLSTDGVATHKNDKKNPNIKK